jgi:beta-phosphoglucomutase-like phosphatase (HAD superfamily)
MDDIINNYDLFIFDLDDTLVKTETYHYKAWMNILKHELGDEFYIDCDTFIAKFHSSKNNSINDYLNELNINDIVGIIDKKKKEYLKLIYDEQSNIKLIDGLSDLIEAILHANKKFVIVSNSPKDNIDFFSELFPILKNSSKNYYREMLINRKPHPECYLKVITDFPNYRYIGFEDSITGIHAMTQVKEIDAVFINHSSYHYYDFIVKNYHLKMAIENYISFKKNK